MWKEIMKSIACGFVVITIGLLVVVGLLSVSIKIFNHVEDTPSYKVEVYKDKDTSMEYLIVKESNSIAITPRLNEYGGTGKIEKESKK